MEFWIAREILGNLYLYNTEPYLDGEEWNSKGNYYLIDKHLFTEVTFENSPQMVEIKLVKE